MSNHSEFSFAKILAILLSIALVAFHFNDDFFFGHSEEPVFTIEEAQQDELAPDLIEESDY